MGLNKELWISDIQENLKMNASFLANVTNHDGYVVNQTVHVPQAGSIIGATKDRVVLPAVVDQRTDLDLIYTTNQYSTNPVLVSNLEDFQINYDKRRSIMGEAFDSLTETIGNEALFAYCNGLTPITTTGLDSPEALAPSATGNRKAVSIDDIKSMARELDKQNVPQSGRKLMMNVDMFYQLLSDSDLLNASYTEFSKNTLETGMIARLFGFDIMIRNHVGVVSAGGTLKAYGDTGAATDHLVCVAWHPAFVAKAVKTPDVMYNENDPSYYGSIFSAIVWAGFSRLRTDNRGVVVLRQAV